MNLEISIFPKSRCIIPLAALLVLGVAGCATMDVKVSILNDAYTHTVAWRRSDILTKDDEITKLIYPTNGEPDKLTREHDKAVREIQQTARQIELATNRLDNFILQKTGVSGTYSKNYVLHPDDLIDSIDNSFAEARFHYGKGHALINQSRNCYQMPSQEWPLLIGAEQQFQDGDEAIQRERSVLREQIDPGQLALLTGIAGKKPTTQEGDITGLPPVSSLPGSSTRPGTSSATATPGPAPALVKAPTTQLSGGDKDQVAKDKNAIATQITSLSNKLTTAMDGIIGSHGLVNDQYASRVVYAPEEYWTGVFNHAYGTGLMGNTDIAIKMQSEADFTVKGVRVDAQKVTQATFASIGDAVKIVAAAYGIPIAGAFPQFGQSNTAKTAGGTDQSPSDSNTPDSQQTNSDSTLLAQQKYLEQDKASQQRRQAAALQILGAIANEQTVMSGTLSNSNNTASVNDSLARINATFTAFKGELSYTPANPNSANTPGTSTDTTPSTPGTSDSTDNKSK